MPRLSELLHGDSVEHPTEETLRYKALSRIAPDYAMLFFDHLYSEYLVLKPSITNAETVERLDELHQKRIKCELTWSDIYSFDLTLVQARPLEGLLRKAYEARAKYRSIAGQKEYDEYVASKPPNLPEIHIDPKATPPQPEEIIERALRADLEYLLSKVYLYYAILPVRERLRDWLTNRAVLITLAAVIGIGLLILINVLLAVLVPEDSGYKKPIDEISVVLVTVLTVVLAGIVGGCVSMLQRIQSAPSEGDALFNLAALTNGWKGIFLSPLYGGIFAALLFVLFAAGLLEGYAFPKINTPRRLFSAQAAPTPTPAPARSPSPIDPLVTAPDSLEVNSSASPTPTASQPSPTATPIATPAALPVSTPAPRPTQTALRRDSVIDIRDFLKHTGPADGTSYALLIIWSFIAGFAERLVPDTLNRVVTKNQSIQGTNT